MSIHHWAVAGAVLASGLGGCCLFEQQPEQKTSHICAGDYAIDDGRAHDSNGPCIIPEPPPPPPHGPGNGSAN